MRAKRYGAGLRLTSFLDLLYEIAADYGWGVRRALSWWAGHIAIAAVLLADGWPAIGNSLLVSFSNFLGFLRLGSEGAYLDGPHKFLMEATDYAEWVIPTVGTVQAVLGPILLFVVLLTLRNRFRLG